MSDVKHYGKKRTKLLRKNVITAFSARLSGLLLQAVSLPIAAAALGNDGFTLYAMLTAIMAWLSLSRLGLGPALTISISNLIVERDHSQVKLVFSTAFMMVLSIASVASALCALLLGFTEVFDRVFSGFHGNKHEVVLSLILVVAAFFVTMNLTTIEAAQVAYQEQFKLNNLLFFGTLISALAVLVAAIYMPSVSVIFVAAHVPVIIIRSVNSFRFMTRNKEVRPSVLCFRLSVAKKLFIDSVYFSSSGPLNNFLSHIFPILLVGAIASASYAASFVAVMNSIVMLSSFFALTCMPLLGAIPEARARGDVSWVRSIYYKVVVVNTVFSVFVLAAMFFFGEPLFELWYQGSVAPSSELLIAAGVYFVLLGIEVTNFSFISASGFIKSASLFLLVKSIAFSAVLFCFASPEMNSLPFVLLVVFNFILSVVPLTSIYYLKCR